MIQLEATTSTNANAMAFARDGVQAPVWVTAAEQAGGRGRRGRSWHSPIGNLYASLLLIDPCPAEIAPQLGFVAGVALVEAVDALLANRAQHASPSAQLKWPNDLLSRDGAKIAGILLEASRLLDGRFACVIGIGVNCRSHPSDLSYAAANLSALAGHDVAPDDLLSRLDDALISWLARWRGGQGFTMVRNAWLRRAAGLGEPVTARIGERTVRGTFETIDDAGRLLVATSGERIVVDAGDVLFGASTPTPVFA